MLNDPNSMPELKVPKKKKVAHSLSKQKSANSSFLTPQKKVKRRK